LEDFFNVELVDDVLAKKCLFLPVVMKARKIFVNLPLVFDFLGYCGLGGHVLADLDLLILIAVFSFGLDDHLSSERNFRSEVGISDEVVYEGSFSGSGFTHEKD
jgi:hypothetical protein